uniref:Uncharacterized protein n=1 Tax=Medicago truncatula TaxID=3880 RepID=I3S0I5_MEDTR|nr:unknown [Medicago truncatula]
MTIRALSLLIFSFNSGSVYCSV